MFNHIEAGKRMRHIGTGALVVVLVGLLAVGLSCGGLEEEEGSVGSLSAATTGSVDGGVVADAQAKKPGKKPKTWFTWTCFDDSWDFYLPQEFWPCYELSEGTKQELCDVLCYEECLKMECTWDWNAYYLRCGFPDLTHYIDCHCTCKKHVWVP